MMAAAPEGAGSEELFTDCRLLFAAPGFGG
jgi:hypothetical protein